MAMDIAAIPREFPQFGKHLTSLLRPARRSSGQVRIPPLDAMAATVCLKL